MRLTKHHGIGNDFLVLVDLDGRSPIGADQVRAFCDRHRGIGADGFLRAAPAAGGAVATMELFNADGGRAEMSGNGIGCLAQALVLAGAASDGAVVLDTDAGRRTVQVESTAAGVHRVRVDMGRATIDDTAALWVPDGFSKHARVDIGNPHLVLLDDPAWDGDLDELGRALNSAVPGGVNVEVITVDSPESLRMRVYERGVGITMACGTGACASAAAAHRWGLSGSSTTVHMDGGDAAIEVGESVVYGVGIHFIASVEVA